MAASQANFKGASLRAMGAAPGRKRGAVPAGGRAPNLRSQAGKQRLGAGMRGDAGTNFQIHGDEAASIADELAAQLAHINNAGNTFAGYDPENPDANPAQATDEAQLLNPTGSPDPALTGSQDAAPAADQEDPEARRQRILKLMGLA